MSEVSNNAIRRVRRLLHIVSYAQSGTSGDAAVIANLHGVSRRTILRDIKSLREAGVHLVYDAPNRCYVDTFCNSVLEVGLSVEEMSAVCTVCNAISKEHSLVPEEIRLQAVAAASKVASFLSKPDRERLRRRSEVLVIADDGDGDLSQSSPEVGILLQAIDENRRIRFSYAEQSGKLTTLFSPYRLVFRRDGPIVVGRSSWHRGVQSFDVLRIDKPELTDSGYTIPPRFHLDRYLPKSPEGRKI